MDSACLLIGGEEGANDSRAVAEEEKGLVPGAPLDGQEAGSKVLAGDEKGGGVRGPVEGGDPRGEAREGAEEVEGEELLAEGGRAPDLDELPDGDGDELAVGAEADGGGGGLEGDAVEDGAAAEVGVERVALLVAGEEEVARGGGGEAGDVGGGLEGEGEGGGGGEVGGRDAVPHRGEEHGGVPRKDGVAAAVRRAQKVLEAVVHGGGSGGRTWGLGFWGGGGGGGCVVNDDESVFALGSNV